MKKNVILTALAAGILLLSLAATSEAGSPYPVIYGFAYSSPGVTAYFGGAIQAWIGAPTSYWADLRFTTGNKPDPGLWPDNHRYDAWCVSPEYAGQNVSGDLVLNFSSTDLKEADYLISHFSSIPRNANQNAALQIAVWEAAIDGTHNFGAGNFQYGAYGNTYLTQANIYLNALSAISDWSSYTPRNGWVTDNSAIHRQDFLIRPVPEPGTLLLLGSGLLGVGVISRYRRNKKA